jgi:hypothetical protein
VSDGQVRELERRWRTSGADADHASLLAELLRTGGIEVGTLEAAALLGHPAARLVVDAPPREPRAAPFEELMWLVEELGRRDARLAFEALTYAVSMALEQVPEGPRASDEYDRRRLADGMFEQHDFLRRPTSARAAHVLEAVRPLGWGAGVIPVELWNAARRLAEASARAHARSDPPGGFAWSPEAEASCGVALRLLEAARCDGVRLRADLTRALRKMAERILPTTP